MRLRTFTARTMPEAMALVRQHLGTDAIILSTGSGEGGAISVTAALDPADPPRPDMMASAADLPPPVDVTEQMLEALAGHGTPPRLVDSLLQVALELPARDAVLALAGALDATFSFTPLTDRKPPHPLMLVGAPGAGKTVSIAKLAARAVLAGQKIRVISSDTVRAGAIAQLEAFTRLLGVKLHRAENARQLGELVAKAGDDEIVLIDSAGINPYNASDRDELADLIGAARAEPVFVLPAGGDLYDTVEITQAFRALGSTRLLVTRLDMVHRLGSVLAAAADSHLSFSDAGISPDVAQGLTPLNPVALARLLMPEAAQPTHSLSPELATP
ncbi:MAG: AAA family ATPase [Alphaproteobacteria bacterium]|nr:AAA family ATPase [Alphaproteobacteria bacterium]